MLYKLKKKHFPNRYGRMSENWVSNGHWIVRKEAVKDSTTLLISGETFKVGFPFVDNFREMSDGGMIDFLPESASNMYEKTNWCYKDSRVSVLFVNSDDKKDWIFFNEVYVELFKAHILYMKDKSSCALDAKTRQEVTYGIMPLKVTKKDFELPFLEGKE